MNNYPPKKKDLIVDDIPIAVRETSTRKKRSSSSLPSLMGLVISVAAIIIIAHLVLSNFGKAKPVIVDENREPPIENPSTETSILTKDDILGHLPYEEVESSKLVKMSADGRIWLHKTAAQKYRQMQKAAAREGIKLVLISGFRSEQQQNNLFFGIKEKRQQNTSKRAEVSAPPGYSEHHTGYAVDIGDRDSPETNLEVTFENTNAFAWLEKNAAKYSFELSFGRNNPQKISYEPWHWRFVGDIDSLKTFKEALNLKKNLSTR